MMVPTPFANRRTSAGILARAPLATLQDALSAHRAMLPEDIRDQRAVLEGRSDHHAILDYEHGADRGFFDELADRLSRSYPGEHYVFSRGTDDTFLTVYQEGRAWLDETRDIDAIAVAVGCPLRDPPRARIAAYLFVEGAGVAEVERAIRPRPGLHLIAGSLGTVAWLDTAVIVHHADSLSEQLGRRTYAVIDEPDAFSVAVIENGKEIACFEEPPTAWSEGIRVPEILGGRTRDEILALLGVPAR